MIIEVTGKLHGSIDGEGNLGAVTENDVPLTGKKKS